MSNSTKANCHIVVAGDVPVDLFVYPTARSNSAQSDRQTSQVHRSIGGAVLIGKFLNDSAERHHRHRVHWPSHKIRQDYSIEDLNAITELDIVTVDEKNVATFKVRRRQRLEIKPQWQCPKLEPEATDNLP